MKLDPPTNPLLRRAVSQEDKVAQVAARQKALKAQRIPKSIRRVGLPSAGPDLRDRCLFAYETKRSLNAGPQHQVIELEMMMLEDDSEDANRA